MSQLFQCNEQIFDKTVLENLWKCGRIYLLQRLGERREVAAAVGGRSGGRSRRVRRELRGGEREGGKRSEQVRKQGREGASEEVGVEGGR